MFQEATPPPLSIGPAQVAELRKIQAERRIAKAEQSLHEFIRQAYHAVKPGEKFVDNWHIGAICQHLEHGARTPRYDCTINVPPGSMKSLCGSVFFPCWVWTWWPEATFFFASYSHTFAIRDAARRRSLIRSEWYRERWGGKFQLTKELEDLLTNTRAGQMLTTSVGGQATGLHPHFIVIDDAHNLSEVESDVMRKAVLNWYSQALPTRGLQLGVRRFLLNQRSHEEDLPGYLMKQGFDALIIPMEYEGPDENKPTAIGWTDPRTNVGELMWPGLFPAAIVDQIKVGLVTQYRISSQLQQRPVPREGGMFKLSGFRTVTRESIANYRWESVIRYWDRAYTRDGGDFSAGVLLGKLRVDHNRYEYYVLHAIRGQWSPFERNQIIKNTAASDRATYGSCYKVVFEQEGNAGSETAPILIGLLAGFNVEANKITGASGNKESRAAPIAAQHEGGNVRYVEGEQSEGPWLQTLKDELLLFPAGKHDDQVDAASGAFIMLAQPKKRFSMEVHVG
jgi:predicted phage terminase large subunit-like protein